MSTTHHVVSVHCFAPFPIRWEGTVIASNPGLAASRGWKIAKVLKKINMRRLDKKQGIVIKVIPVSL